MKPTHSFSKYYEILNLAFDSDLSACKRAYKRSVKQWHPDKFINDNSKQHSAEEKIKEINIAYSQITEFYHKNSIMPGIRLLQTRSNNEQEFDISSLYQNLKSTKSSNKAYYYKYIFVLVISLFLIIVYQVFSNKPELSTSLQNHNENFPIVIQTSSAQQKTTYSIGSTVQQLLRIQGEPDYRISQTWYYGNSWVLIQNNIVSDFYQDKEYPLKAISEDNITFSHRRRLPDTFKKGDSKSDVRAIQGDPDRRSRDVWYYQISKVYFKDNKVSSWFNSPLDPLRVKK